MDDEIWSRTLEHIPGVAGLNKSEVRKDVKEVEHLLEEYRNSVNHVWKDPTKELDLDPAAPAPEETEDAASLQRRRQQHLANLYLNKSMPTKKRSRGREVMSAEEIIETLPVCRRAVRLTQAELMALKRERLELEDNYLRLRTTFIHELELMMKEEKDQERVMLRVRQKVSQAASRLLSAKRRNTAMQDVITELEARGDTIYKLEHEVSRLRSVLAHHQLTAPMKVPGDEFTVGDLVLCTSTREPAVILALDVDTKQATIQTQKDSPSDVAVDEIQHAPEAEIFFTPDEAALKATYFEKAGEWITAETALRELIDKGTFDEDDDLDDDDEESDADQPEAETTRPKGETKGKKQDDDEADPPRKRAKTSAAVPAVPKRKSLLQFKGSRLPATPFEMPLLISPLGELPGFTIAAAPEGDAANTQWLGASLPQDLVDWENDRLEMMKMKGEIERLKFQLRQSEVQKKDAQHHVSVQLESINKLVSQLEKEREAAKDKSGAALKKGQKKRERRDSLSDPVPSSPVKAAVDEPAETAVSKDESDIDGDENENDGSPDEVVPRRTTRSGKLNPAKPEPTSDKVAAAKRGRKDDVREEPRDKQPTTRRASTRNNNPRTNKSPNGSKSETSTETNGARRSSGRS
ncbi:hypothetical protein ACHHYP_04284 [Achlya hypogyna]|uniref:Uncharacterized protein n=1 Tax=Achlya hypogyna TaxID=1202772 RepID=A0A1V9Z1H7_ACHHY|nr:hypothetical protein ACHHYP_04284 [Achlya hypogyna]